MKQIALEATQPATSSSWYSKRNVRYENVKTPANKMTVHIGWKILLICLLGMIALSLLAVVYFSMAIK
jgi:hypothetical protein